ncbi:MAG: ATP-binding protein [Cyanobacteria bacterium J06629_2]
MGKISVLLLEDNAGDAYLVKEQLKDIEGFDCKIDEAQYLKTAIELLQNNSYEAVLLDLMLPDSKGIETFFAINQQAPNTAIVVISALTEEALAIQAVQEGAQDYLAKGQMQPNTLYKTIQYAIERKSVTQQLIERTRELEAFNYTVSHDLKNPLNFIKGMSSLLLSKKRSQPLDEQDKICLERIHNSSLRMEQITKNLLDLSLAERSPISIEEVNLSEVALEVANNLRQQQPERQVKFAIALDIIAQADRQLIKLVLENLLGNAWKYTQNIAEPIIEFCLSSQISPAAYCIKDNGIGFAVSEADRLFIPFERLSNSRGFEGTGIGLATVKRIITRHQGEIWFDAQPDQGAIFKFTLNSD